ncbi:SDR family NAD(P)-dependent oxidoreductase [Azospirillum sp.]|uniref:SDR family NAD(P)-dependent oxidoreductase n=1 Tax=Azospirillum sp. TaxID=34012 RepID=UPI003D7248A7
MTGRTALITGALGQDGVVLATRLAAQGERVIGLVRPERAEDAAPAGVDLLGIDLTDPAAIDAVVARTRPDLVFHVAAVHHASEAPLAAAPEMWRAMTAVNFQATTHLIQAILAHAPKARLVYTASSHMYRPSDADAGPEGRVIDEESPRDPVNWYGMTKHWSAEAIRFMRDRHGLHGSTAILFNHESHRRPESFVSRKITRAAARIARAGGETSECLHLRNIGALADWSCADEVTDALLRMGEAAEPGDYVVGSGTLVPVRALAEAAFAAVGLDWTRHVTWDADRAGPAVRANPAKIAARLGWTPRVPITEVIRRMVVADCAGL